MGFGDEFLQRSAGMSARAAMSKFGNATDSNSMVGTGFVVVSMSIIGVAIAVAAISDTPAKTKKSTSPPSAFV